MRFSFFSFAATVCLAASVYGAAPAAESGASAASVVPMSQSVAAVSQSASVAAYSSAAAAEADQHHDLSPIVRPGGTIDVVSLLLDIAVGVIKTVLGTVLGGLGLSLTDAQYEQVQQSVIEEIGGAEGINDILRLGGFGDLISQILQVIVKLLKEIIGPFPAA